MGFLARPQPPAARSIAYRFACPFSYSFSRPVASLASSSQRFVFPFFTFNFDFCWSCSFFPQMYQTSLLRVVKKTAGEGLFPLFIVDSPHPSRRHLEDVWGAAKRAGFEAYVVDLFYVGLQVRSSCLPPPTPRPNPPTLYPHRHPHPPTHPAGVSTILNIKHAPGIISATFRYFFCVLLLLRCSEKNISR